MAAGVLPQSEQPFSAMVNSSGYTVTMEGHSGRPAPKYTKVGERLRHVIPGHMACSMACGGKACKYENPSRWSEQEQAVKGLYSSWVTENILAMARPSTELLEKYCIIEQFRSHGIKTIINLQRPGEHASCGNPLEQESGFTYLPEAFMETGIYFYNFGWKDYGVASLTTILDMVKVMTFALQEGKVAVHCHAGLGRTGVLIACYLVFATRMTADQAILFVRAKRPNSIQTRGQLLCIREFTQFLTPLRNVFSCCDPKAHAVTLAQYLIRQRHLLHGYEARLLKHVPKIVHLVCQLLLDLAENRPAGPEQVAGAPGLSAEIEKTVSEVVTRHRGQELLWHSSDAPDSRPPSPVTAAARAAPGVILPSEQGFDPLWKRRNVECLQPLSCLKRRLSYSDSDLKRAEWLLEQGGTPWTAPAQALLDPSARQQKPLSHCCTPQTPHVSLCKETLIHNTFTFWTQAKFGGAEGPREDRSPASCRKDNPKEVQRSRTFSSGISCSFNPEEPVTPSGASFQKESNPSHQQVLPGPHRAPGRAPGSTAEDGEACPMSMDSGSGQVTAGPGPQGSQNLSELSGLSVAARRVLAAKALANLHASAEAEDVRRKVEMWQKELNSRDGAWERICGERNPFVLCSLMWSWVEQLKEPVISKEDVDMLVRARAEAPESLFLLEKGQHQTILCVLHCLASLRALPVDVEEAVLAHSIKAFTKVNLDSENGPVVYNTLKKIFKHTLEEKRKVTNDSPGPGV